MSLVRDISLGLGMSQGDILRIILTAPKRYKVFKIEKRSGRGERIIAQPASELKDIQRFVVAAHLKTLKIHSIATAYRPGLSIKDNALAHAQRRVIMKLDFHDFFHSISPKDLQQTLKNSNLSTVPEQDRKLLNFIFFWDHSEFKKPCLAIGAPSSPFISNVIMESLDREISKAARACSVKITRYADDITLSANSIENLIRAEQSIRKIVSRCKSPTLRFNEDKRGIYTSANRKIVTGLVITPDGKVSLGRDRKRSISAAVHHIETGRTTRRDLKEQTRGWLSYAKSVEPTFFESMMKKYPKTMKELMRMSFSSRDELAGVD